MFRSEHDNGPSRTCVLDMFKNSAPSDLSQEILSGENFDNLCAPLTQQSTHGCDWIFKPHSPQPLSFTEKSNRTVSSSIFTRVKSVRPYLMRSSLVTNWPDGTPNRFRMYLPMMLLP